MRQPKLSINRKGICRLWFFLGETLLKKGYPPNPFPKTFTLYLSLLNKRSIFRILSNGDSVKKLFPLIGAVLIISCGALLYYSYYYSSGAVWSLLFGSHGCSCWEVYKPLGLTYILWILIELSYLRPSLLRFVCAKGIGLYVLCLVSLAFGTVIRLIPYVDEQLYYPLTAAVSVLAAQFTGYRLYAGSKNIEWLIIPILVTFVCMIFMLLFLSFFPPDMYIFKE